VTLLAVWEWIERKPLWQQHVLKGALVVVGCAFLRGAWLILPLGALVLVVRDGVDGLVTFLQVLVAFVVAVLGGALAGAVYTLIGRHFRRIPLVGPFVAGTLSAWPYVLVVLGILDWWDPSAGFLRPRQMAAVVALMSAWIGLGVGYAVLRDD
jgi:hypothetical protein